MVYRFLGNNETPDQQIQNEIGYLGNFDVQVLGRFVDMIFEFMIAQQPDGFIRDVTEFASDQSLSENLLKNICRGFMVFLKGSVKLNLTPTYVKEDLINFRLSEEQAELVSTKYKQHFIALSRSFAGNSLSVNQVLDMQWRFGVTVASSSDKQQGSTFLQLKLVLDKGDNAKEDVHMELTLPQFYQFLKEMEKAKSSLEYFN
ncbi:COMM domain-containing protein 7 [Tieghemostelium lacteum]|uniref:COMM domain-containing protein 7 n=1 Tax=Tieghemostelium lacteum TaxID=361077 RepID=A0A151ZAP7_TIELA|nr:COMM domain-containing protein 7 [Tieghemostelium lacteum]|eukprot:KYQ91020.1 COMM domain-containing protein 7 [Tieghemostelium lacteum]